MSVILFPTDHSGYSENAFQYLLYFADRLRAKIIFLHVIETEDKKKLSESEKEICYKKALQQNHELTMRSAEFAFQQNCEIVTEQNIVFGNPLAEILKIAEDKKPTMIAMSTHAYGHNVFQHTGETVSKLLEHVHCPVLVIPEQAFYKKINNIALATSPTEQDETLIYKIMITAALFKAKVHIFHIENPKTKGENQVIEYFKMVFKYPVQSENLIFHKLSSSKIANSIQKYVEMESIQLICLEHYQTFFPELMQIKIADRSAFHKEIPTLVFTDQQVFDIT